MLLIYNSLHVSKSMNFFLKMKSNVIILYYSLSKLIIIYTYILNARLHLFSLKEIIHFQENLYMVVWKLSETYQSDITSLFHFFLYFLKPKKFKSQNGNINTDHQTSCPILHHWFMPISWFREARRSTQCDSRLFHQENHI